MSRVKTYFDYVHCKFIIRPRTIFAYVDRENDEKNIEPKEQSSVYKTKCITNIRSSLFILCLNNICFYFIFTHKPPFPMHTAYNTIYYYTLLFYVFILTQTYILSRKSTVAIIREASRWVWRGYHNTLLNDIFLALKSCAAK